MKPGNDVSGWIDKNIIQAGEAAQSDVVKASKQQFRQEVQDADGVGGELAAVGKYVAQNPLLAAAQAAGSFAGPGLAVKGAGLAARAGGLAGKAVETAGRAGGVAAGAALAGGDAAGTAYDLAKQGGATEEQAVSAARGASVLPAVVGGAGGAFGAERLLAGGKGFAGGAAARALKTGASEAAQEAVEEGVTQYEGQRAAMPFDPSIDPSKGVAAAAGMGAALGGVTGAGTSLLTGGHLRNRPSQAGEQAPDTLPDVRSYAATIDQMVLPESQQEYRDMLARATDESLSVTEREAAANALHRAFNPDLYQRTRPEPLQLGNQPPERVISYPDGSVGLVGGLESYLANLPEDQREEARAKIMGQSIREVNDPAARQARRWWENYGDGQQPAPGPDYLAEVQAAVRSGTQFSTQQTVDTVRDAMEDAWLAQNVGADPAGAPAPGAGLQAADAMGVQLQGQFQQASEDAGIAAVDARVRTGRILSGLQNLLDGGAENSAQVLGGLNEGLARINEQPLDTGETQRVRRMVDAYMGFRGVGEPAPLPADRAPAVDPFADNAAMEALIPSVRCSVLPSAWASTPQTGRCRAALPWRWMPASTPPSRPPCRPRRSQMPKVPRHRLPPWPPQQPFPHRTRRPGSRWAWTPDPNHRSDLCPASRSSPASWRAISASNWSARRAGCWCCYSAGRSDECQHHDFQRWRARRPGARLARTSAGGSSPPGQLAIQLASCRPRGQESGNRSQGQEAGADPAGGGCS